MTNTVAKARSMAVYSFQPWWGGELFGLIDKSIIILTDSKHITIYIIANNFSFENMDYTVVHNNQYL